MPSHITSGRCAECRRRKRKCDELYPSCTVCTRAGVTCIYPGRVKFVHMYNSNTPSPSTSSPPSAPKSQNQGDRHVQLSIRTSQNTTSGTYHTFSIRSVPSIKQPKSREIPAPLCRLARSITPSDADRLACSFGSLIQQRGGLYWIWGNWSQYIPQRIGTSPLLDHAVTALMYGCRWRLGGDESSRKPALTSYGRSISLLKDVFTTGGKMAVTGELVAAMHLLMACEPSLDETHEDKATWDAHIYAAVSCFVTRGPSFCEGELERAMFYATYATILTQAHLKQLTAVFDTADWYNIEPAPSIHSSPDYRNDPMERRRRFITTLPHLMGLVRQFIRDPNDARIAARVTQSLTQVLALDNTHGPSIRPPGTTSMLLSEAEIMPSILHYSNLNDTISYSYQWSLRIAIYGLCQQMESSGFPIRTAPLLAESYREMYQCALLICMTLPHLSTKNERIAGGSLFPLQMAWTGLWTVRNQHEETASIDRLLKWLEECVARTANLVGREYTRETLIDCTETLQGGPLKNSAEAPPGEGSSRSFPFWEDSNDLRNVQHSTAWESV